MPRAVQPPKTCGVRQCGAAVLPARWDEDRQVWRSRCERKRAGNQVSNHECWYDEDEKGWMWTSCLSKALGIKGGSKGHESQGAAAPKEKVESEEKPPEGAANSKGKGKKGKKGSKGTQNSKGKGNTASQQDTEGGKPSTKADETGKGDNFSEKSGAIGKETGGADGASAEASGSADGASAEASGSADGAYADATKGADGAYAEATKGQKKESGLSLGDAGDKLSEQAGETAKGEAAPLTPEKCLKPDKWSSLSDHLEHFDRSHLGNDDIRPLQQETHATSSPRTPVKTGKGVPAAFRADAMSPIKCLERPQYRGAADEEKPGGVEPEERGTPGNASPRAANPPAAAPDAASGNTSEGARSKTASNGSADMAGAAPDAASGNTSEGAHSKTASNGSFVKMERATIKREPGKPSTCALAMVRRADEIRKPGQYLDVVDLMLHCFKTGKGLQMVTHEKSEAPLLEDFWGLANQFMGPQADLLPIERPVYSPLKLVLCRASYEPSDGNPVGLNHFIPLWHRFELDRETIDKILQAPDDELATLEAMLKTPMPKGSSGMMWISFLEETKERIARIDRFKQLQQWLAERDLIAAEVLADGNCAVWSLLVGESKNPFLPVWEKKKDADDKRSEIAKSVEEASESRGWQALYSVMYDVLKPAEDAQEQDAEKKVKRDPETPSKRPKANPPIFMDLTTPPRKAKEVMVDGAQRGAYPEKRKAENPVFGREPAADQCPEAKAKARKADFQANVEKALGQSSQRPAAPKRKLDEKEEEEEEEEEEGDEQVEDTTKPKKKRNRTCKKKVRQDSDKRVAAAKAYLGSIGISWLSSQAVHGEYRWKNLPQCTDFGSLHTKLLEGELPDCVVCAEMLKAKGFDKDSFQAVVESATDPSKQSPVSQRLQSLCEKLKNIELQHQAESSGMAEEENEDEGEEEQAMDEEKDEKAEEEELSENVIRTRKDVCKIIHDMGQGKFLQALPLNSHDRRVPIRCLACRTRRQPEGKVFECSRLRKDEIRHYIKQHCGPEHLKAVAEMVSRIAREHQQLDKSCGDSREQVPCRGVSLTHGSNAHISKYKDDFVLWARYTRMNYEVGKHEYTFVAARDELLLRNEHCEKILWISPGEEATCTKCQNTETAKLSLRCATKFSIKYWAALLLSSKLFKGEDHTENLISSLKATYLYSKRQDRVEAIIPPAGADTSALQKLQKFVRMSWTKIAKEHHTELSMSFMVAVVNPALSVNPVDCTSDMQRLANQFTALISSQNFEPDSLEALNLRILKHTAGGKLSQNPATMGIVLQCLELMDRSERGVSMKKRRKMGDREESMVHEAAMLLASNGCSAELMHEMGFNKESTLKTHNRLDNLLEQSLPCPALSLLFTGVLEQNMQIIDSIIPRDMVRKRRMCVCFDFTYLTPIHSSIQLHGKKGLVGSPFAMQDLSTDAPGSFQVVLKGREMGHRVKANRMLELLVWDPSSSSLQCWSPLSMPLSLKHLNTDSTDSSWEVFRMLDAFADRASDYCKLFICDGEACNSILKSAIFGQLSPELKRRMFQTKFFSRLRHAPLQGLDELPHFPIRLCMLDDGDSIFCMPGTAHAVKNAAGQVCSETKVPYFGRHFCDATGALEFSLPIPAYVRKDGMSDRLSSLLANPFFLMRLRDDTEGAQVDIPWHLRGMLLWNVSTAMCVAPAVHGALTLATRCELAICGHICYDLWALTSSQREKEHKVAKGKFQLAHQTRRNLQAVALSTVTMCASKNEDWDAFRHPHGLSEIHIERFFGRLRSSSASGDLSARQFWNAEAAQMRRLSKQKHAGHVPTAAEEKPLDAAQLRSCAQNALNAALQLVSRASGIAAGTLHREYMAESTGDFFDVEEEEEETVDQYLADEAQVDEVKAVLSQIGQVAADEYADEAALDESEAPPRDLDLDLPDGLALVDLTSDDPEGAAAEQESPGMESFPQTLRAALAKDGNMWSNLWQLAVFLRCSLGGMDSAYLKKGEVIRQRARKLNWHQTLEHELKEIREQEDEMLAGQRGSRLAKWIAASDSVRQQAGLTAPEAMKIGKVVVLHTGTAAEVALVHTMWPMSKKPKPCVQEIPLERVKCFRATILLEKEGSNAVSPTEFTWMFTPEHVLALLDVMEADVASGKIVLTPSSKSALATLKAQELPELEVNSKRKRRAKVAAEKDASAPSAPSAPSTKLSFKKVAKKVKQVTAASAATDPAAVDPSQADDLTLIGPCDIRRSNAGRNAVKRFVSKLLDLDALHFAAQPCFDLLSRECTMKVAKGYKRKDFLSHIPFYFQYTYFTIRSPEHFGHKVHSDLSKILGELQSSEPGRKGLQKLIADCKSCKLKGSVQA